MSDTNNDDTCPKCQMPRQQQASGSLTQWMFVCKCNLPTDESTPATPVDICAKCGKRVSSGRSGTLTQWIFRADLCSCEAPVLAGLVGRAGGFTSLAARSSASILDNIQEIIDEDELQMDGNTFPVERYAAHRLIGRGAAGSVYLCRDRLLAKNVALKVLNVLNPELLIAFQSEAKNTSQINHAGIVKVLDFGATGGGYPYMVLEYIKGVSLDKLIAEHGSLQLADAIAIMEELCDALAYAHNRDVFHRDIKPSNIIIEPGSTGTTGGARLIDFGVGAFKRERFSSTKSQSRTVVGTPAYMSPDQALGFDFDARSEIYSLGCVLFEMLTGKTPFEADSSLEMISMHANAEPPALADAKPDSEFPEEVETIVAICLNKERDRRYQDTKELKEALHEVALRSRRRSVEGEELVDIAPKRVHIPPLYLGIGAAVALVLIIIVAIPIMAPHNEAPVSTKLRKNPKTISKLGDAIEHIESKPWHWGRSDLGIDSWQSSPVTTDESFKLLADKKKFSCVDISFGSNVTGKGFKYIKNQPLTVVFLQAPNLTDEGLAEIAKIKTIEFVRLTMTDQITPKGMESLLTLPRLDHIDLLLMKVPEGMLETIAKKHSINLFSVYQSKNVTTAGLSAIQKGLPDLMFLDLTSCGLKADAIDVVAKMKSLIELRAVKLDIAGASFDKLRTSPLKRMDLSGSTITDADLEKLAACKSLESLRLYNCANVTKKGANFIKKALPDTLIEVDAPELFMPAEYAQ